MYDPNDPNDPNRQEPPMDPDPLAEEYDPRGYNFQPEETFDQEIQDYHSPGAQVGTHVEDVYMGTSQDLEDRIRLRANMSKPMKKVMPGWAKLLIFLVLFVGAISSYLYFSKVETIDDEGRAITLSTGAWLKRFTSRSDRQVMLEQMSPEYRAFYLTRERLGFVHLAVAENFARNNQVPRIGDLLSSGKLKDFQVKDGWGNDFRVEATGRSWRVFSIGADGLAGSNDDLVLREEETKPFIPSVYQAMELEVQQKQKSF